MTFILYKLTRKTTDTHSMVAMTTVCPLHYVIPVNGRTAKNLILEITFNMPNITSNVSVNGFKGVGGWRSSHVLSSRAMRCDDNMRINMDESPQLTPSQAPVVLKSACILKADNAVVVRRSRTAGLPCRSPSHTLPPLRRLSAPASLP